MSERFRRFVAFWSDQGTLAVGRLIRQKLGDAIAGRPVLKKLELISSSEFEDPKFTLPEIWDQRFNSQQSLHTYMVPQPDLSRISLVTDSISSGSLFGGVGTALLFSAMLANRKNAALRIVTRTEPPSPTNVELILSAYNIRLKHEIQFSFVPPVSRGGSASAPSEVSMGLDTYQDELFITTSWWTTAATLPSVPSDSIIYLLQEDERMFYSFGEERVQCERVLQSKEIRFVVNTRLLYDHLIATGLDHLESRGCWFEPAFPKSLFHERERDPVGKKRFFFYARPNNPRNLFFVGIDIIDRAINQGIIDLEEWDIFLVGKQIPNVTFGDGYIPRRCEGLDWQEYAELVGTIDLGLCLMYTPHPSYPPLDLAASGAVVVTNKFANKQDLSSYSRNILCVELNTEMALEALRAGVALAQNKEMRTYNFSANGLGSDWTSSFEATLQSLMAGR